MTEVAARRNRRWFIVAAAAALVAIAGLVFWPTPRLTALLPSPNGYDDIVKAGALLTELRLQGDYRQLPEQELRQLVASNAPALGLLRTGLGRECRVPIETSEDYIEKHISELAPLKRLAVALAAEGRLHEIDGQTNGAVRSYVDAIRLGHEAGRGGLLIDALVGLACEAIGAIELEKKVRSLDAKGCRWLIEQLQLIEARRQPAEETLRIERRWSDDTYGFLMRVRGMIASRAWDPIGKVHQGYATRQQVASVRQSRIIVALATRAFELEQGRLPAKPTELVPGYLSVLPRDISTNALQSTDTWP